MRRFRNSIWLGILFANGHFSIFHRFITFLIEQIDDANDKDIACHQTNTETRTHTHREQASRRTHQINFVNMIVSEHVFVRMLVCGMRHWMGYVISRTINGPHVCLIYIKIRFVYCRRFPIHVGCRQKYRSSSHTHVFLLFLIVEFAHKTQTIVKV